MHCERCHRDPMKDDIRVTPGTLTDLYPCSLCQECTRAADILTKTGLWSRYLQCRDEIAYYRLPSAPAIALPAWQDLMARYHALKQEMYDLAKAFVEDHQKENAL